MRNHWYLIKPYIYSVASFSKLCLPVLIDESKTSLFVASLVASKILVWIKLLTCLDSDKLFSFTDPSSACSFCSWWRLEAIYWAKINEIKHFILWPIRSTWDLNHYNGWTHIFEFSNKSDFDRHSSFEFLSGPTRFLYSLVSTDDLFTQFAEATGTDLVFDGFSVKSHLFQDHGWATWGLFLW